MAARARTAPRTEANRTRTTGSKPSGKPRAVTRASGGTSPRAARGPRRAAVVWTSLLAAMTVVGGGLLLLSGGPTPGSDGLSIPPLMALSGPSTAEAVFNTREPIPQGRWQAIVIHDSGSPVGTPASMDARARAMNLKGLGYHFVIGNGNGLGDGEIHVGARWLSQVAGAHAAGADADWFNLNAIGICLVGDGDRQRPTPTQLRRLTQLTAALARELKIPQDRIYLHSDIAQTTSPGRLFPEQDFRGSLRGAGVSR
jgi:hypothetical protein